MSLRCSLFKGVNMNLGAKLLIRDVLLNDAEDLKRFWLKLTKEMYDIEGYIIPSTKNAEIWLSFALKEVEEGRSNILVAQEGLELVGFIHLAYGVSGRFETSSTIATIHEMYVKPRHRGRGIGTMLLKEGIKRLKEKGIKQIRLSVLSGNEKAVRFYEKHGFKVYRYNMHMHI